MLISTCLLINKLKPIIPATILLAPVVPYFIGTLSWHAISTILPEKWFRSVDDRMYSVYQRLVLFVFENISGVSVTFYGDVDECLGDKEESVLYLSNHQCTVDWAIADMIAARQGNSLGRLRYMLKDVLQYVPLYGWYFYRHGCVYVRRSGQFQGNIVANQLNYLSNLEVPLWMIIFPEGTRYSPNKPKVIEESRNFAIHQGLQPFEHVLTPRSKGFKLSLKFLREKKLKAVYDVTIAYDHTKEGNKRVEAPDMFSFVCCPSQTKLYVHLKRIPIENVPVDEEEQENWLHERFAEKEKLLKHFYTNYGTRREPFGEIFGKVYETNALPLSYTLPSTILLTFATFLMLRSKLGNQIYVSTLIFGSLGCIAYLKLKKAA